MRQGRIRVPDRNFDQYRQRRPRNTACNVTLEPIMPARPFYHLNPDVHCLESTVVDARPGRVLLDVSPFYPGGGGQLPDRGVLRWRGGELAVSGFENAGGGTWILLADPAAEISGHVEAVVDTAFRQMMRELHTGTHVLNAFVFQAFDGALVTGVQMNDDGTARMDFDVPDADNDTLRALEGPINDAIRQNLPVRDVYIPLAQASGEHGLIRSKSVAPPPTTDGLIRIVDIVGLDRQACGGTHLSETGASRPIRILKIDNKGRHNRRVRIGLVNA
jgi:misacylated tRNA(Ala) deacylase